METTTPAGVGARFQLSHTEAMPARRGANTSLSRSSPTMSIWARGTASRATTASQNRASAFLRPRSRKQKISATKASSATRAKARRIEVQSEMVALVATAMR